MRHLVLGTAGHIDHGKTTLIRALTGVDTDRLPEEKRRGITIDLGFARLVLNGVEYAVVDVPGHESLVRNMLAGATGIDVVLLVVAADEGVMPQTDEHLAIMQLLGVRQAVVALTKADLVDRDWLELAQDDVRTTLARTPWADAPVLPVSAVTGSGLDQLRAALLEAGGRSAPRSTADLFRLPVDRVFSVHGTGTVVTGTVWSGRVRRDAVLRVQPGDFGVRVRGIQRHGEAVEEGRAGERIALAVVADRDALWRGLTLTDDPGWRPASILTARLTALDGAMPLAARQRVRVHLGTQEVLARVALPGRAALEPGEQAWGQLRLEQPLLARARDRFVIRSYSPVHTIAGGIVIEPDAPRRRRLVPELEDAFADILAGGTEALRAVVLLGGEQGVERARLPVLTGLPVPDQWTGDVYPAGTRLFPAAAAAAARARVMGALEARHRERPLDDGASREELRRAAAPLPPELIDAVLEKLAGAGLVSARGPAWALPGFEPQLAGDHRRLAELLAELLAGAGLAAPRLGELPVELRSHPDLPAVARRLAAQGRLVMLAHDHFADSAAISEIVSALRAQVPVLQPVGIAVLKRVTGLSRKYLLPLLEYLDRVGVTRRVGEERMLLADTDVASGGSVHNQA